MQANIEALSSRGVEAINLMVAPSPITPSYFVDHGHGYFSWEEAKGLVAAFTHANMLSPAQILVHDPRQEDWRKVVTDALPQLATRDGMVADASPLSELMNMAHAFHEITDAHLNETIR